MELKFVQNVLKRSIVLAVFCSFVALFNFGASEAFGLVAGTIWGGVNLWLITRLLQSILLPQSRNFLKFFMFFGIKFPLLYLIGYFMLALNFFPAESALLGFSLVLLVTLLNSTFDFVLTKGKSLLLPLAVILPFVTAQNLSAASIEAEVPELPNFISLLYKHLPDSAVAAFLHYWDSLVFSIGAAAFISLVFYLGTRNPTLIPTSFQNFLEWIVENLQKFVLNILGPQGEKYVPFLGTLFLYILVMNWLVLVPLMKAPSSNFNITVALAICVFVLVQYLNIKNYGILGFLYHMAGSPKGFIGWALVPLMFPIELLTQFTRPVTLALRLFGNVLGEDILIGAFALFGVTLLAAYTPIGLPLQIPFMFLALLTGLMQALVFTLLSTIYILLSENEHEEPTSTKLNH
jgi:F-type H+-transporting ATPase subunit a